MSAIITLISLLLITPQDVEALRITAPQSLTTETAHEHLVDARIAGWSFDVDPDLLLSIAWFESRYTVDAVGPNVRGKHACGVLQPIMEDGCQKKPTLLGGYLEGAKHLRAWLDASRGNLHTAMLGYAGGRNVATVLVGLSFFATFVSTNSFVGHSAKSYTYAFSRLRY